MAHVSTQARKAKARSGRLALAGLQDATRGREVEDGLRQRELYPNPKALRTYILRFLDPESILH